MEEKKHLKNNLKFHMNKIEELTNWMHSNLNSDAYEKVANDRKMYIEESNKLKKQLEDYDSI